MIISYILIMPFTLSLSIYNEIQQGILFLTLKKTFNDESINQRQ